MLVTNPVIQSRGDQTTLNNVAKRSCSSDWWLMTMSDDWWLRGWLRAADGSFVVKSSAKELTGTPHPSTGSSQTPTESFAQSNSLEWVSNHGCRTTKRPLDSSVLIRAPKSWPACPLSGRREHGPLFLRWALIFEEGDYCPEWPLWYFIGDMFNI